MLIEKLPLYFDNKIIGTVQDESKVTFCPSIKKEEEKLSLDLNPKQFVNYVRALSETPGAYLLLDGAPFKIYRAHIKCECESEVPTGTILEAQKSGLVLKVKGGEVYLDEVQKSGKKKMDYKSFLNGEKDFKGKVLK